MKTLLTILMLTVTTFSTNANNSGYTIEILSLEKVPIVAISLNGQTAYFVLDSGSDVSLLHSLEAGKFQFTHEKRASKSIVGASGGKQPSYEATQIDLQIDRQPLETQFYATDLSSVVASLVLSTGYQISGIVGLDLMRKYGFEIDYGNQQLVLHGSI